VHELDSSSARCSSMHHTSSPIVASHSTSKSVMYGTSKVSGAKLWWSCLITAIGNRAIVAWMTRYGPEKYRGRKTLPIKQLIALGKLLCDKLQDIGTLPSDVDYYFKEVIKERAYLSQHFRSHRDQCDEDITDTINHEHFTERSVCPSPMTLCPH